MGDFFCAKNWRWAKFGIFFGVLNFVPNFSAIFLACAKIYANILAFF